MPAWIKVLWSLLILSILGLVYGNLYNPGGLVFLLLIPIFSYLFYFSDKNNVKKLKLFFGETLFEQQVPRYNMVQKDLKRFFLFFGLFFVVLALCEPKWGFHWEEVHRKGSDIIIALDISESMLAEDLSPNRLERSKRKISDLLEILEGDRIGMVVFAGQAFALCPLTLDYGAVAMFLDDIDTDFLPVKGTNISEALEVCMESFRDFSRESKAIILITDGEQHEGKVLDSAEKASKKGIKIFSIGIGNPKKGGVPIPLKGGGVKKTADGNIVLTKINESLLAKIVHKTGGAYKLTESGDIDLIKIYEEIKKRVGQKKLKSQRKKVYEYRFQWFLFIAILCFFFSFRINIGLGSLKEKEVEMAYA
ncbi:VWA domain-containing protein [Candidatus Riflebacteria bacterium]